jgi:hypothetical protein
MNLFLSVWMMLMTVTGLWSGVVSASSIMQASSADADWGRFEDGIAHQPAGLLVKHNPAVDCESHSTAPGLGSNADEPGCKTQTDCELDQCTTPHALATAFYSALDEAVGAAWPQLSLRPFMILLPPPGQPPKHV